MKATLLLTFSLMLVLNCSAALANGEYRTSGRCEQELLGEESASALSLQTFNEDFAYFDSGNYLVSTFSWAPASEFFRLFAWTRSVRGTDEKIVWTGTIDLDFGQMIVHAEPPPKLAIRRSLSTLKFIFKLRPPTKTEIALNFGQHNAQLKILRNFFHTIYKVAIQKQGIWSMSVNGEDLPGWTLLFKEGTPERENFFSKLESEPGPIMVTFNTETVFTSSLFLEMEWLLIIIQKR